MKTVIDMAREAGIDEWWDSGSEWRETLDTHLELFAELVRTDEREACAKVVEASPSYDWHKFACEAAAAIRARSNT